MQKLRKRPMTASKEYKKNKGYPTNFAHQDRMALFAPYTKINKKDLPTKENPYIAQTYYGEVCFEQGILDQIHRDIWQILFTYNDEFGVLVGKDTFGHTSVSFTFTSYKLSKYLGSRFSSLWIYKKLKEMSDVRFTLKPDKNEELNKHFNYGKVYTGAFNEVGTTDDGKLFVSVSPFFLQCYFHDTAIHSEKMTCEIIKIKEGYLKALIYHILTHQVYQNSLDNLMYAIGLPSKRENPKEYRKYKNLITKPEVLNQLKEIFKISFVKEELSLKWNVRYEQKNLDGKVWSDNELNQYSRLLKRSKTKMLDKR